MRDFWRFARDIMCTFEFLGVTLLQCAITMHFKFNFTEAIMLGGGLGMLTCRFICNKSKPIIIHITLPDIPQKD